MTGAARKVNGAWHSSHRMPANPTERQRAEWHLEHSEHCGCRPVPESLKARLVKLKAEREGHRAN